VRRQLVEGGLVSAAPGLKQLTKLLLPWGFASVTKRHGPEEASIASAKKVGFVIVIAPKKRLNHREENGGFQWFQRP
jgi:hypothetical protein